MQRIKTLSFNDSYVGKSKVVSVSFSDDEKKLFDVVSKMTSTEIKKSIGIADYRDLTSLADKDYRNVSQTIKMLLSQSLKRDNTYILSSDVTFRNSKDIPFQRWYPYIEGYSPGFVKKLIENYVSKNCIIYEPFAGTGTTLFASDSMGFDTYYSEVNPLLRLLIDTKIKVLKLSVSERNKLADTILSIKPQILEFAEKESTELRDNYKAVFGTSQYFPQGNLKKILSTKTFLPGTVDDLLRDTLTIAVLSSLIPSSLLKKQGDLRFKTKKELEKGIPDFGEVLEDNLNIIIEDLRNVRYTMRRRHTCITPNTKQIGACKCGKIGCVITSPPYLNGTNYIRNTKLELWFMGELKSKADLRELRDEMLTSGINDVKAEYILKDEVFGISKLYDETIEELRHNAYDKRIPLMAQSYFAEMYDIFSALREKLAENAVILIDIGDSIFNGIHIRTDDILAEILTSLGYTYYNKEKLRERRSRNGQILSQTLLKFSYGDIQQQ